MDRECGTCKFGRFFSKYGQGECWRHPPILTAGRQRPLVGLGDFCGEYVARREIDDATRRLDDDLRSTAIQRAIDGWEEPVVHDGKLCYDKDGDPLVVRKFSPELMIAMLGETRPLRIAAKTGDSRDAEPDDPMAQDLADLERLKLHCDRIDEAARRVAVAEEKSAARETREA